MIKRKTYMHLPRLFQSELQWNFNFTARVILVGSQEQKRKKRILIASLWMPEFWLPAKRSFKYRNGYIVLLQIKFWLLKTLPLLNYYTDLGLFSSSYLKKITFKLARLFSPNCSNKRIMLQSFYPWCNCGHFESRAEWKFMTVVLSVKKNLYCMESNPINQFL